MVEIYHQDVRVAMHIRSPHRYRHTTVPDHMPEAHRRQSEWTPERLTAWGASCGEHVAALFDALLRTKTHPEQGFRACLGIMRLGGKVGNDRLDAACRRALAIGGHSYTCVRTILERGLDRQPLLFDEEGPAPPGAEILHENVRGAEYYRNDPLLCDVDPEGGHAVTSHG